MAKIVTIGLRAALALAAFGVAGAARAGSYTFSNVDAPAPGYYTTPLAINNHDQIVGLYYTGAGGNSSGFVWQNGTLTPVAGATMPSQGTELLAVNDNGIAVGDDVKGAILYRIADHTTRRPLRTAAMGNDLGAKFWSINNHNVVAGSGFFESGPGEYGFVLGQGMVRTIQVSGNVTELLGINDQGQAFGDLPTIPGYTYFTYVNGQTQPVALPRHVFAKVNSISQDGTLAGTLQHSGRTQNEGFVISPQGVYESVRVPGALTTWVTGANERGVFGTYIPPGGQGNRNSTAFIRRGGVYYSVKFPGAYGFTAAVSGTGDFVGTYVTPDGTRHGYIATCAPAQQPCTH